MTVKYCIYSFRRSGRHIVEEFLRDYLKYDFCNCCIDDETITKECYSTHIHLKHETKEYFDTSRIKKCLFLYRKDIVDQVDSIVRLLYTQLIKNIILSTTEDHVACIFNSHLTYQVILCTLKEKCVLNSVADIVADYRNFIKHMKHSRNSLIIDFDSLVYDPTPNLKKIANFFGFTNQTRIKKAINAYLPSLKNYTKKKMCYTKYIELMNIINNSLQEKVSKLILNKPKLLVVSHGGSATTTFIEFIKDYISTNCSKDLDGLKHTLPSKIEELPSKIIYIYGDMDKTMRSLFRRKAGNLTIASIHEHKLKGIKHSVDLPANFEDFEAYTNLVVKENKEPVGCLVHMREWKKVPDLFFIHYEQICKSDTIDEYLGIPKGTCSQFTVMPRTSQLQPCETPEYLETMKGLDLRVQGIITGQPHKTNILFVSFPRSGFNLLQLIFYNYLNIKHCSCQRTPDVKINTCSKEDMAFHRAHDMNLAINKSQFNKIIILYRKDIVEQLDAFFRYQFRNFEFDELKDDVAKKQTFCHELSISYSEKLDFFKTVLKQYNDWVEKWVTKPTPNSILIEYSDFMKNPQETLDKVQEHLLQTKDSGLSAKIVEEMKIEYKHSLSPEKYKELANLLLSFI